MFTCEERVVRFSGGGEIFLPLTNQFFEENMYKEALGDSATIFLISTMLWFLEFHLSSQPHLCEGCFQPPSCQIQPHT